MKTYIYFVRHAISPFSLGNERTRGLSEQGKSDSDRVAELLKKEEIDHIVSSSYVRAVETLKPLAEQLNLDIIEYEELIERPIANLKYKLSEEEVLSGIEKSFKDIDYIMLEGESTGQAQDRAIPIIKQLLVNYKGKKIAVGTHGNIMTIILNYFDKSYGFEFSIKASKPDIYKVEFEETDLKQVERLWKQP